MIGQNRCGRVFAAVLREHLQQTTTQRKAAGRDVDDAALQALVGEDLLLGSLNAFERNGNVRVQLFPPSGVRRTPCGERKNSAQRSSDSRRRMMRVTFG